MRCFVAIDLEEPWRRAIARLLPGESRGGGGANWVRPDSLHITLWFLGEVPDSAIPAVSDALSRASREVEAFELRIGRAGCFPSREYPRVLWIGAEDPAEGCRRWIAAATPLLAALGFAAEARPFHAHITLARSREGRGMDSLRAAEAGTVVPKVAPMVARGLTLFSSVLGAGGARYVPIARFQFGKQIE